MLRHRVVPLAGALVALILLACGGDDDDNVAPTPAPTQGPTGSGPVETALATYVQNTLQKGFVEDCAQANAGQDAGKVCAIKRGERNNLHAYILGNVASEPNQWAIVGQQGNQWTVVKSVSITGDNAAIPGIPWPLTQGAEVVVVGADPGLNVREGPSLNQKAVDAYKDGTKIKLGAGPVMADNLEWWQVEGRTGWVAGDYLRYPDAAQ